LPEGNLKREEGGREPGTERGESKTGNVEDLLKVFYLTLTCKYCIFAV